MFSNYISSFFNVRLVCFMFGYCNDECFVVIRRRHGWLVVLALPSVVSPDRVLFSCCFQKACISANSSIHFRFIFPVFLSLQMQIILFAIPQIIRHNARQTIDRPTEKRKQIKWKKNKKTKSVRLQNRTCCLKGIDLWPGVKNHFRNWKLDRTERASGIVEFIFADWSSLTPLAFQTGPIHVHLRRAK